MTTLHLVPIGPQPNEWHWLEDGCRCGRKARLRAKVKGHHDGVATMIYECERCGIWLATAYDVPIIEWAVPVRDAAWREARAAAWTQIASPNVTNTHRGYRCRSDGRRYRLDAIGAWLKSVWTGRDDWS